MEYLQSIVADTPHVSFLISQGLLLCPSPIPLWLLCWLRDNGSDTSSGAVDISTASDTLIKCKPECTDGQNDWYTGDIIQDDEHEFSGTGSILYDES